MYSEDEIDFIFRLFDSQLVCIIGTVWLCLRNLEMSYFCLRLLSAFVLIVICAAHEYGHQSVKTYGGYIKQNDNQDHSNNIQQYKVPQYQPPNYGWNLNQPSRTYGNFLIYMR